jgi:hypothetical protein
VSPARVAFFDPYPDVYGGIHEIAHVIAAGLAARGWEVAYVAAAHGPGAERAAAAGIGVEIIEPRPGLRRHGRDLLRPGAIVAAAIALPMYWGRLARAFRRYDAVYTTTQRGMLTTGVAARLARRPLVWNVQYVFRPRLLNFIGRVLARRTLAVTARVADGLPALLVGRAPVVANPIDDRFFRVTRSPSETPLIVTSGRLSKQKGLDLFLRALARVRTAQPDVEAAIMGGPQAGHESYGVELKALCTELDLDEVVHWAGFVSDPEATLARATVFVQSSRWEGQPLAVIEAMAVGAPVVGTRVNGVVDVVTDGVTGVLVPPEDDAALADAILGLLADPERRAALADAAHREVFDRHAPENVVARMERVFEAVSR